MRDYASGEVINGPLKLRSRIIHAGPTCGKSTWCQDLNSSGIVVLDTDLLFELLSPDGEWVKVHRAPKDGEPGRIAAFAQNSIMGLCASIGSIWVNLGGALMTNLWGPRFTDGLHGEARTFTKMPSFTRDPEGIAKLSEERGGEILDVKLTRKWAASYDKYAKATFSRTVTLSEGEFLGNVLLIGWPRVLPVVPKDAPVLLVRWYEYATKLVEGSR
jgi:hypothetical protein